MRLNKSICIVTPGYLSSSPRTVKEADALQEAGYDVRVVFSQGDIEDNRANDAELLRLKKWRYGCVRWSSSRPDETKLYQASRWRHAVARLVRVPSIFWAGTAVSRIYPELLKEVLSERADLYIGHYPAGLAAVCTAARKYASRYAFDSEDFHIGETAGRALLKQIHFIQKRCLGGCSYVTAASERMAEAIERTYSISRAVAIYNVFPLKERTYADGLAKDRRPGKLSLYWYSQTVGEDRGIQNAIRACGLTGGRAELHLRGHTSEEVKKRFFMIADSCGMRKDLYFHPPVSTGELLSRSVEHDVGLASEEPVDLNRRVTVSNKFFYYLLAGLAPAVSDVESQKEIFSRLNGQTGFLYQSGDVAALAEGLLRYVDDPSLLQRHKKAALDAATFRWSWELESQKLVETVGRALAGAE